MELQRNFMLYTSSHNLQSIGPVTDITFTAATNTIADVHATFDVFTVGEKITVSGAGETGNNTTFTIATIAANYKSITTTETVTEEASGASVTINEHLYSDFLLSHHYEKLAVTFYASQNATIYIDQSYDGVNTDYTTTIPYLAATTMSPWEIDTISKYFRVRVLNGSTDQTTVRLFVSGKNS